MKIKKKLVSFNLKCCGQIDPSRQKELKKTNSTLSSLLHFILPLSFADHCVVPFENIHNLFFVVPPGHDFSTTPHLLRSDQVYGKFAEWLGVEIDQVPSNLQIFANVCHPKLIVAQLPRIQD